ncbi:MAG: DUF1501 domain-containing protein [Verrucomicrobiales bacterium]
MNAEQRRRLPHDSEVDTVVESFELAWRLQMNAPDVLDLGRESAATRALYGIDEKPTDDFGRQCLMARRLAEAGVRFIQVTYAEKNGTGRDHNPNAFTVWLAGAGVKPGIALGDTDEFGGEVAERPVHMHDLHATILHLLGLNHEQLTFPYDGRPFRLTDVHGLVVPEMLT